MANTKPLLYAVSGEMLMQDIHLAILNSKLIWKQTNKQKKSPSKLFLLYTHEKKKR